MLIDEIISYKNLLQLTWINFGLFVIQVILLPILMFWIIIKIMNNMFDADLPAVLKHSSGKAKINKTKPDVPSTQ